MLSVEHPLIKDLRGSRGAVPRARLIMDRRAAGRRAIHHVIVADLLLGIPAHARSREETRRYRDHRTRVSSCELGGAD